MENIEKKLVEYNNLVSKLNISKNERSQEKGRSLFFNSFYSIFSLLIGGSYFYFFLGTLNIFIGVFFILLSCTHGFGLIQVIDGVKSNNKIKTSVTRAFKISVVVYSLAFIVFSIGSVLVFIPASYVSLAVNFIYFVIPYGFSIIVYINLFQSYKKHVSEAPTEELIKKYQEKLILEIKETKRNINLEFNTIEKIEYNSYLLKNKDLLYTQLFLDEMLTTKLKEANFKDIEEYRINKLAIEIKENDNDILNF